MSSSALRNFLRGRHLRPASTYNPRFHNFVVFLATLSFLLLIAGALVTSNKAGLSVPDWPTSFGSLYRIPPMVGGVKYEHGHRMLAELVGLFTIVLAIWCWKAETRRWMRWLGVIALFGVIIQGVLGGLTVRMLLPWYVSTAHAAVAQTFFCLLVVMALFTSRGWINDRSAAISELRKPGLYSLCLASLVFLYLQLFFGAAFRHGGISIAYHIFNGIAVTAILVWTSVRAMGDSLPAIKIHGRLVHALLMLQILLGIASYMTRVVWGKDAPQPLPSMVASTVAHLGVGALLLAFTFVLAIQARRSYASEPVQAKAAANSEVTA